jgi:hypothetical protein
MKKASSLAVFVGLAITLVACGADRSPTVAASATTTQHTIGGVCCANPHGETETPDAPVTRDSALPVGTTPPPGSTACQSDDLKVQSAFSVPVHDGPGLFVRIFNVGDQCWLDGRPKVSLHAKDGDWRDFRYVAERGSTTNGPEWTGEFDPSLTAVVVFGAAAPMNLPPTTYDALRLTLPNEGGQLEFAGATITLTTDELSVYPFEADSQDE